MISLVIQAASSDTVVPGRKSGRAGRSTAAIRLPVAGSWEVTLGGYECNHRAREFGRKCVAVGRETKNGRKILPPFMFGFVRERRREAERDMRAGDTEVAHSRRGNF
jgi:hypothetical protein